MNVEDSYEGAVRRLQRLEMAGIAVEPAQSHADDGERMRELEELATLACEDNERLKQEFGAALQELDQARRDIDGARAQKERAQLELGEARHEVEQLRGYVASLEQSLSAAQQQQQQQAYAAQQQQAYAAQQQQAYAAQQQAFAPAPEQQAFAPAVEQQAFAPAPSPFASPFGADIVPEEDYGYPPKSSGGAAKIFVFLVVAGAAIAGLAVLRPWERPRPTPIVVEQPAPQPPPVVTAPPPVVTAPPPVVTAPKVAPTLPKAAPVVAAPRAPKARAERKHPKKHAAAKKHASAKEEASAPGSSDDPLGGTGL